MYTLDFDAIDEKVDELIFKVKTEIKDYFKNLFDSFNAAMVVLFTLVFLGGFIYSRCF